MTSPSLDVRKNIRPLCKKYFDWELENYQIEVLEAMFEGGYLVVNLPTDHGKSSLGCFLFPLLSLMENPNETHIICCANIADARRRVQALQLEIETNKALIKDFPHLAKPTSRANRVWSSTAFSIVGRTINKPNPSVVASTYESRDIKGRRGKLIMDDLEGEDARWSPVKREQLYGWLKFEAWRCYEDKRESSRPLLCLLGTPFDVDSIYFRVEHQGWKVIRYPVYTFEGFAYRGKADLLANEPHFVKEYLWPAKAEKVERARRALRKLEFSVAYRMDPTGGDPTRVSSQQIQERMSVAAQVSQEHAGYIALDPASGAQGPRVDYAGIAVVKIHWPPGDELPEIEIPEAYNFSQGLFEQVHLCAELHEKYGFPVIYERNAQQGQVYADTFRHLHPEVPLIGHYTSHQNKFDVSMGLSVIKRLAIESKLFVPEAERESDGIEQLVVEIRDLQPPFKTHNHISAAIWFAVRHAYDKVRHYSGPTFRTVASPFDSYHGYHLNGRFTWNGVGMWKGALQQTVTPSEHFGFGLSMYQRDPVQEAMRQEWDRFASQLRGPEARKREEKARYARMMKAG